MTKKSWTQIAWLACGLAVLSAPGWADDAPALKRLKDLAGHETPDLKDASPKPVLINDDNADDSAPAKGERHDGSSFKQLWRVMRFVTISDVKFVSVIPKDLNDPDRDPDLDLQGMGYCVKLSLTAELGVRNDVLETRSRSDGQDSVSFYLIGQGHLPLAGAGMKVAIDYFWSPEARKQLKDGESALATLRFPLSDPKKGPVNGYFEVSAKVTGRDRPYPGHPTFVDHYLDISDVQVRQIHN